MWEILHTWATLWVRMEPNWPSAQCVNVIRSQAEEWTLCWVSFHFLCQWMVMTLPPKRRREKPHFSGLLLCCPVSVSLALSSFTALYFLSLSLTRCGSVKSICIDLFFTPLSSFLLVVIIMKWIWGKHTRSTSTCMTPVSFHIDFYNKLEIYFTNCPRQVIIASSAYLGGAHISHP